MQRKYINARERHGRPSAANMAAGIGGAHDYETVPGFEAGSAHGDPPFHAEVVCGGARLNLRHTDRPAFAASIRRPSLMRRLQRRRSNPPRPRAVLCWR